MAIDRYKKSLADWHQQETTQKFNWVTSHRKYIKQKKECIYGKITRNARKKLTSVFTK